MKWSSAVILRVNFAARNPLVLSLLDDQLQCRPIVRGIHTVLHPTRFKVCAHRPQQLTTDWSNFINPHGLGEPEASALSGLAPQSLPQEVQTIVLGTHGVAYVKAWCLYVCIHCKKGLRPSEIPAHMHKNHTVDTNAQWKQSLNTPMRLYPGNDPATIKVCFLRRQY